MLAYGIETEHTSHIGYLLHHGVLVIEPYFAAWLKTTKELSKEESWCKSFSIAWKSFMRWEQVVLAVLIAVVAVVFALGFMTMYDPSLLGAYIVSFGVLLAMVTISDRVITLRDRRVPTWNMESKAKANSKLRKSLKEVGLTNTAQLRLVREEATRELDRKMHRYEMIVHVAIEVVILAALVWILNFVTNLLDHGLRIESALFLAGTMVVVSFSLVFLVAVGWKAVDGLGPLPVRKLRTFVDDLSRLLIEEAGACDSAKHGRSPVRSRHRYRRALKRLS